MSRQDRIKGVLSKAFKVEVLEIFNESHLHSGPRQESHFKIYLVSSDFDSLSRVERQQKVYKLLQEEFESGLHALSLRLKSPNEIKTGDVNSFKSPNCTHKS